jgi:hypothetical protein
MAASNRIKKKSLVEQVLATDYAMSGARCPHSPAATINNLKRHDKILAKMRKAGVTEDEIDFLTDFYQADALHVFKLSAASDAFESGKKSLN